MRPRWGKDIARKEKFSQLATPLRQLPHPTCPALHENDPCLKRYRTLVGRPYATGALLFNCVENADIFPTQRRQASSFATSARCPKRKGNVMSRPTSPVGE